MKIKRFVASDMRQAMREVREDQGPDAVILSTRRMDDGIEIIAAVDFDEALVREAARHGAPLEVENRGRAAAPAPAAMERPIVARRSDVTPPPLPPVNRRDDDGVTLSLSRRAVAPRVEAVDAPAARAAETPAAPAAKAAEQAPVETAAPIDADLPANLHPLLERAVQDTARVRAELGSLRELLETQLSSLIWNDMERRQPMRARVLREMTRLGIEPDVARQLVDELPAEINAEQARYLPLGVLSRSLSISPRDHAERRGVTALVGSTGVGKTTTIAKLAARAVMRHGASQVALVSTDHYRIGAAAQLEHYGRLLGVRVYPAYDADSLRHVLELLRGHHTVLVDTAGLAGGDPRLAEQLDVLRNGGDLRACLVLAANAHASSLDEAVRAYLPVRPHACILTKLDEAPSLGGALSVLIRHRLALDYVTDGQRVPEDIATADARVLVCRAAQALKGNAPADDMVMADRFGLAVASA
ncbi:flagellar biosynthesis protein FlhF [Dyella jiangningensis]|uniref:flagellar biosynthesis protein FlhF n=1 Tax=Dyella sp. AtDHG13 TaxID=1938897 RepID=UPI00088D1553|nr:flagellar biosynthesis protein FlhF [Dyella sp. AtDHG13]PXV52589.1 flagellar biosynthesis protein FlhF [Dyella sp. AtDHG13]SDL47428.1 flagellar biosynthesis protein FlhF [Dyella jiangningensis]